MKLQWKNIKLRRGYTSLVILVLSLFFFAEAIAAAGDIFFPIVYHDIKPTPTATSTPTLIPGGVIVLPNHSSFTTTTGILHVVGEVQNNTNYTLRNVRITANFYNNNNQFLDSHSELTFMNDLPPNTKTCFNIGLDEPEGWRYYQFDPVTYQTDGEPLPDLTIYNVTRSYGYQFYRLAGYVRNDENVIVSEVRTVGTLYDPETSPDSVIGCNFHQLIGSLDPGDDGFFEINFTGRDYNDPTSYIYHIQTDGNIP